MNASAARLIRTLRSTGLLVVAALAGCGGGGGGGSTSSSSALATGGAGDNGPVPTVQIEFSAARVAQGQSESVLWSSTNATSCSASGGWSGSEPTAGEIAVATSEVGSFTYTLTCQGAGGSQVASATYLVTAALPAVHIAVSPADITLGSSSTLTWNATNASSCSASGAWSGSQALNGAVTETPGAIGPFTYTLTCTGAGGQSSSSAALTVAAAGATQNQIGLVLDSGPAGTSGVINVPYVSVTVCLPGTTQCGTIDHVLMDTGSYGLRLINSAALPSGFGHIAGSSAGTLLGECQQFVSGFTWGSVTRLDVKFAGELASSIPVEVIGDGASNFSTIPASCSGTGANEGSVAALGANGILGVGLGTEDCGTYCVTLANSGLYYSCTPSGACSESTAPLANQVINPVAAFTVDNNGVVVSLPAVASTGAQTLSGTLTFGVNTEPNNQLGSQSVYLANADFNFTTTFNSQVLANSFIDSGSNALYFNDPSIATCPGETFFDCPPASLNLTATNASYTGSVSAPVAFTVVDLQALGASVVAASIAGSNSLSGSFDWGLPFFFGRPIFVVIEGQSTTAGTGPFWAY